MKQTLVTALALLAAATLGFAPAQTFAAEKTTAAENKAEKAEIKSATGKDPAAAAKEALGKPLPFTGTATAVDAGAKTFSLNGAKGKDRVFTVDDATKITKENKPATLADIKVGDGLTGSYVKAGEVQTAKSVKIGQAKAAPATPAANAPAATPAVKATPAKKP